MTKPRIWPSLLISVGVIPFIAAIAYATLYVIVSPSLLPGQEIGLEAFREWMEQHRTTIGGFLKMNLPLHASLLLIAIIAAWRSKTPWRERLGLVRSSTPIWHYVVFIMGGLGANTIGAWIHYPYISPVDDRVVLSLLYPKIGGINGAMITLYAATVCAFAEELLFRGFMMRGLLRRWKPIFAIGICSLVYMVAHANPFFVFSALPVGIWFSIVAWRTDSIWPVMACHSVGTIVLSIVHSFYPDISLVFFDEISIWLILVGLFCIIALGYSIYILFRNEADEQTMVTT